MKLQYYPDSGTQKWHAITDDGGWDGSGATPLDAVADLVVGIEKGATVEPR